jgi:hypothetical protein
LLIIKKIGWCNNFCHVFIVRAPYFVVLAP